MYKYISYEEIENLYNIYKTPSHVIKHCKAVSETAKKIALSLNEKGYNFDVELIEKSGLVHDAARIKENHGIFIAEVLSKSGYIKEADTVREHMTYILNDFEMLNETDIFCLGDRLVKEDRYVGLDERMNYVIEKAKIYGYESHIPNILEGKKQAIIILNNIEKIIGCTMDSLFL